MAIALSGTGSWQNSSKRYTSLAVANVQCTGTNRGLLGFAIGHCKTGSETHTSCVWDSGGADEVTLTGLTVQRNGLAAVTVYYAAGDGTLANATHTLTFTSPQQYNWNGGIAVAVALNGVDGTTFQDGINSATGSGGSPSVSITTESGDWLVGALSHLASATISPTSPDVELQDVFNHNLQGVVNYDPTGNSLDCTGANTTWVFAGVNVNQAGAGGLSVPIAAYHHFHHNLG